MHSILSQIVVNVNGNVTNGRDATISVFDRSYLYGDSLYEVARTYKGKLYKLPEHIQRLRKSAELCHMIIAQDDDVLMTEMQKTLEAFQKSNSAEAYVRIILSRGIGKIGFGLQSLLTPTLFTIIVQPIEELTAEKFKKGFNLSIVSRWRNPPQALDPAMKSGNYLNSLLAYLEAQHEGAEDALMCDYQGFVTEGTTFNVFYVKNGILATPPLNVGILAGITRIQVIETARRMGFEVREVLFPKERLFEADEIFVSSTLREVFPVTVLNGKKVNNGKPGPITQKLSEAFHDKK